MKIGKNTSLIEIFRNGMIGTRVMNTCRKMQLETVADVAALEEKYGGLAVKFGPHNQTGMALEAILCKAA